MRVEELYERWSLQRVHLGYFGLWVVSVVDALGLGGLGFIITWDRTTTAIGSYSVPKRLMHGLGVPGGETMLVWGIALMVIAGLVLAVLAVPTWNGWTPRLILTWRGYAMALCGLMWVLWSAMFTSYAIGHRGVGLIGGLSWAVIATGAIAASLTWTGYAHNPRPRPV